jgi:hypothetical protein
LAECSSGRSPCFPDDDIGLVPVELGLGDLWLKLIEVGEERDRTRQPFDLKISSSVAFGMIPSESDLDAIS